MKLFWQGLLIGLVAGLVVAMGVGQALGRSSDLSITGRLRMVTETTADSYLNARLYVSEPVCLGEPVYLSSSPDVNDLVKSLNQSVTVRGEVGRRTLNTGESILTMTPRQVTVAPPP